MSTLQVITGNGTTTCVEDDVQVAVVPQYIAPSFGKQGRGRALLAAITICLDGLQPRINLSNIPNYAILGESDWFFADIFGGCVVGGSSILDNKISNLEATGGCVTGGSATHN